MRYTARYGLTILVYQQLAIQWLFRTRATSWFALRISKRCCRIDPIVGIKLEEVADFSCNTCFWILDNSVRSVHKQTLEGCLASDVDIFLDPVCQGGQAHWTRDFAASGFQWIGLGALENTEVTVRDNPREQAQGLKSTPRRSPLTPGLRTRFTRRVQA